MCLTKQKQQRTQLKHLFYQIQQPIIEEYVEEMWWNCIWKCRFWYGGQLRLCLFLEQEQWWSEWRKILFIFNDLLFGLSSACYIFTIILRPCVKNEDQRGSKVLYLFTMRYAGVRNIKKLNW